MSFIVIYSWCSILYRLYILRTYILYFLNGITYEYEEALQCSDTPTGPVGSQSHPLWENSRSVEANVAGTCILNEIRASAATGAIFTH